jgi:hypothetical protein
LPISTMLSVAAQNLLGSDVGADSDAAFMMPRQVISVILAATMAVTQRYEQAARRQGETDECGEGQGSPRVRCCWSKRTNRHR